MKVVGNVTRVLVRFSLESYSSAFGFPQRIGPAGVLKFVVLLYTVCLLAELIVLCGPSPGPLIVLLGVIGDVGDPGLLILARLSFPSSSDTVC